MFAIIGSILSLVLPTIGSLGGKIADAKIAAAQAATDKEKIAADERVKTLEAKRDALVASPGIGNSIMRALYGLPPAIYLGKLYVWDKVLGLGTTDTLSPELWNILWTIVGFYFLDHTVRIFRR